MKAIVKIISRIADVYLAFFEIIRFLKKMLKNKLSTLLQKKGLLDPRSRRAPLRIFVTDHVRNFARIGESFLGERLKTVKFVKIP